MLKSKAAAICTVTMPDFDYRISMVPFNLKTLSGVSDDLLPLVKIMVSGLKIKEGKAFLTADCKKVQKGVSHRRPGAHIDGNYLGLDWGRGGGGGWKVGDNGSTLTKKQHQESYCTTTGGMLIVSDYQACKGWQGLFDAEANAGGSCEHLTLDEGFWLNPLTVYHGSSQFIHQSMPVDKDVTRRLVRITLPINYPML